MKLAARAFGLFCRPAAAKLEWALEHPQKAQAQRLAGLAADLRDTAYAKAVGFGGIEDWERLPVVAYEDLDPWVARIRRGESRVCSRAPVRFFEKTSGSSGAAKYVPYTPVLQSAFGAMFQAWAFDLLQRGPNLGHGSIFFSISPRLDAESPTQGGIPVGLPSDAHYLGRAVRHLIGRHFAVPEETAAITEPLRFRQALCHALLRAEDLEVVSVWNPTFLSVLLDHILEHLDPLLRQLHDLTPARRSRIREALARETPDWSIVWPQLRLLSMWTDGAAQGPAQALAAALPHVWVQGKGLLATEAPLTVPWIPAGGCVPLPHLVHYEFLTQDGRRFPLHRLDHGATYEVIVSAGNGFCRYRMGDRVRVVGRYRNAPLLEFVGRSHATSDLVGEKLHEEFVTHALTAVGDHLPEQRCLVPILEPGRAYYVLLLDRPPADPAVGPRLEGALGRAHHYGLARQLGQLEPLQVQVVPDFPARLGALWEAEGKALGDLKPAVLWSRPVRDPGQIGIQP